ncbi:MAG: pyridoxal phosphate-dependent aminotransferase [Lachnospiraceae bacterium]|nr:pyridoxal phosphate-dependent aminotransferase [Lachnospiraceae bacterium]
MYDFEHVPDRTGTASLKYDFAMRRAGRTDLLPMWVADMDFALPEEILDRIRERTSHGIFGYTDPDAAYFDTLESWFVRHYGWEIDRSWVTVTPGVVYAISCAVRAFTAPGDAVLIQEPVYYPFREMIELNGRRCVSSPLKNQDGYYRMDLADAEKKIAEENVRLFILCSPHNPVGRVWKPDELREIGSICTRHDVIVVSDEIHCDFVYGKNRFTSYGSLGEMFLRNAVICTSPSKTFNMAGLQTANILISNASLRERFRLVNEASGYSQANTLGLTAAKAAYDLGDAWLCALLDHLEANIREAAEYLRQKAPAVRMTIPEGTYLLWMDFSQIVNSEEELRHLIRDRAHLWLDDGSMFAEHTALFQRMNIACPQATLRQALTQLGAALGGD